MIYRHIRTKEQCCPICDGGLGNECACTCPPRDNWPATPSLPEYRVVVHSMPDCQYCTEAKAFLAKRNIPYTEYSHPDKEERQQFYDRLGIVGKERTMPQNFVYVLDSADFDNYEHYRIGGAYALRMSGIESLFAIDAINRHTATLAAPPGSPAPAPL